MSRLIREYPNFHNRNEAGILLAEQLVRYVSDNSVIIALPRGGVPVAFPIAKTLRAPLDVMMACSMGSPYNPNVDIGAIAEGNIVILDQQAVDLLKIPYEQIRAIVSKEKEAMNSRIELYRDGQPMIRVKNRTVILVDDGATAGMTLKAAIQGIRKLKPKRVVLTVPACLAKTAKDLQSFVDEFLCLISPIDCREIAVCYERFEPTTDEEVVELLRNAASQSEMLI